jgi:hypothetical protein
MARKVRGIHRSFRGRATVKEAADATASLSDLTAEEDEKERG